MIDLLILLPFSSGPVHDLGMLMVLGYTACVYGVWRVAVANNHPMKGLLMAFTVIAGFTGWGFLLAFGWARWGARRT